MTTLYTICCACYFFVCIAISYRSSFECIVGFRKVSTLNLWLRISLNIVVWFCIYELKMGVLLLHIARFQQHKCTTCAGSSAIRFDCTNMQNNTLKLFSTHRNVLLTAWCVATWCASDCVLPWQSCHPMLWAVLAMQKSDPWEKLLSVNNLSIECNDVVRLLCNAFICSLF